MAAQSRIQVSTAHSCSSSMPMDCVLEMSSGKALRGSTNTFSAHLCVSTNIANNLSGYIRVYQGIKYIVIYCVFILGYWRVWEVKGAAFPPRHFLPPLATSLYADTALPLFRIGSCTQAADMARPDPSQSIHCNYTYRALVAQWALPSVPLQHVGCRIYNKESQTNWSKPPKVPL